jgi:hypothetical protein
MKSSKVCWEQRLSQFLRRAIASPEQEPEICEELIEYVLHLVKRDRSAMMDEFIEESYGTD